MTPEASALRCSYPECGKPAADHYISAQTQQQVLGHGYVPPSFPGNAITFEVWEVHDGKPFRRVTDVVKREQAERMAQKFTEEAEQNYTAESLGPVRPTVRKTFIAVQARIARVAL